MAVVDPHGSARQSDPVTFTGGIYTAPHAQMPPIWDTPPTGIVATVAGTVVGTLLDDGGDRTFGVVAGMNPLRFKTITESGTSALGLVVVRG